MYKKILRLFLIVALLLATPLTGVLIEGDPVASFLEFPPKTKLVSHEGFSILFFVLIAGLAAVILIPFIARIIKSQKGFKASSKPVYKFPAWGWAGIVILIVGWVFAWTRFQFLEQLQIYSFTLPWIGYIISVNAFTYWRVGKSLITHSPKYLLLLFVFSAFFWWYYEYLNQFTHNWFYTDLGFLSDLDYFLYATLPFATVLPAVISTWLLLQTFPRLSLGLNNYAKASVIRKKKFWWLVLLLNLAGLSLVYILPQYLFPLLWLSPMLIIASVISISGGKTIFHAIENGRWKHLFLLAVAGLICGFFWELWNYYSYAKWEYSLPFAHRYLIFEMPVLGYLGYLPFGIQCGFIGLIINRLTNADLDYSLDGPK